MNQGKRRTLKEWREARNLSLEGLERRAGVNTRDLRIWERDGYPPVQGGPGKAIVLADAFETPLETIDYGPNIRAITEAGCQFVLATQGRDDRGWEAFIAEWRRPDRGARSAPEGIEERAGTGMRTPGPTARASLDTLEDEIRELVRTSPPATDE